MKNNTPRYKRIAFMASLPPPSGGEANATQTFFKSLPSFGYELRLIDTGVRDSRYYPGKVSFYNLLRGVCHMVKLIFTLITFRPACVNLIFSYSALGKFVIEVLISKILGVHVIAQMHDPWINQEYLKCGELRKKYIHWVFRLPDGWVVLGEIWKNFMICASVPICKICIIPNAVKSDYASLAANNQNPHGSNPPVILFTGTVGYRKGVDLLLEALSDLEKDGIRFKALIVGNGEMPGERERLINSYQQRLKADNFEFIAHREQEELISLFMHADIFILPSRAENLPVAMLEAMSCALPVIVSRVGAVEEVIENGENGLLIKPGQVNELKEALLRLLQDQPLRLRLGRNARQTILQNHLSKNAGNKLHLFMMQIGEIS